MALDKGTRGRDRAKSKPKPKPPPKRRSWRDDSSLPRYVVGKPAYKGVPVSAAKAAAVELNVRPWEVRQPPPPPKRTTPIRIDPGATRLADPEIASDAARRKYKSDLDLSVVSSRSRERVSKGMTPERRDLVRHPGERGQASPALRQRARAEALAKLGGRKDPSWLGKVARFKLDPDWLLTEEQQRQALDTIMASAETAHQGALAVSRGYDRLTGALGQAPVTPSLGMRIQPGRVQTAGPTLGDVVPESAARVARATVQTGAENLIGIAPGAVLMATQDPRKSLAAIKQQYIDYYGRLARGDYSVLDEQGVAPIIADLFTAGGVAFGTASRVGALARTGRYLRTPRATRLRVHSAGKEISPLGAYGRAATFAQEPTRILGTSVYTMGRRVPIRHVLREAQVREGEPIQAGDKVFVKAGEEEKVLTASKENGLAGIEAPRIGDPHRHTVNGEEVDVVNAYRLDQFAQRMAARSTLGQKLGDLYWSVRGGTGTQGRAGFKPSGKGARAKLLREEAEVQLDRDRGILRAFQSEHRKIQKDIVQSTAYDRMLRFEDPLREIGEEIENRRQRGLDQTKAQKGVLAALEKAREHVASPSPELERAVEAGRAISNETEEFLVTRGFLSPERADSAKLSARRWNRPGHAKDPPLSSPERDMVQEAVEEQFGQLAPYAMQHTDTLARAWGAEHGRDPADWYAANIRSVQSATPEQIDAIVNSEPYILRQIRRTPTVGEAFPFRDPETGHMRVARMVDPGMTQEMLENSISHLQRDLNDTRARLEEVSAKEMQAANNGEPLEDIQRQARALIEIEQKREGRLAELEGKRGSVGLAVIEWVREPKAGARLQVPIEQTQGITSRIGGWYSGLANEAEKLPEKASRVEIEAKLRKAPGVKKDEWKWMQMDEALDHAEMIAKAEGHKKSIPRDIVVRAIRARTFRFETHHLARDEAFFEHQYNVTLPGPRWDYSETLIHYPDKHYGISQEERDEAAYDAWRSHYREQMENEEISEDDFDAIMDYGMSSEDYDMFAPSGRATEPLFSADHFGPDQNPHSYGYDDDELDLSGNLLAWTRQSGRWAEGSPLKVVEEGQSDVHQSAKGQWRPPDAEGEYHAAASAASIARSRVYDKRQAYADALIARLAQGDRIDVYDVLTGERGHLEPQSYPGTAMVIKHDNPDLEDKRRSSIDIEPIDPELRPLYDDYRNANDEYEAARYTERQAQQKMNLPEEVPYSGALWEELLFREAVRQAVANGETRIAWTTGAQQAERYNKLLAANVRKLEWDGANLVVYDQSGARRTFDAWDEEKLTEYVGTSMAKKLANQLDETPIDHGVFRVDRPIGDYQTETLQLPISETREGDVVWVGYPSESETRRPMQFLLRERAKPGEIGKTRFFIDGPGVIRRRNDHVYGNLMPFYEGGIEGAEFAQQAKLLQKRQYEDYGESRRKPAVLEGEGISVGGGGFIDAYDRRWRSYAKRYLKVEPRLVDLDALRYETRYPTDQGHPDAPTLAAKIRGEPVNMPTYGFAPIHRVMAGDTVLAESESLQGALQAAYNGGPNSGFWPSRVRWLPDERKFAVVDRGGRAGESAPTWERVNPQRFDDYRQALEHLDDLYRHEWIDDFDSGATMVEGAGPVWVVDIPEEFATNLHEKGSPLFQRRRGSVLGLARLTDEGADIYLSTDGADIATWVEEATHAVIPKWFDDADARGDVRADHVRSIIDVAPGEPIDNVANETMVRLVQAWLHRGALPSPQLRTLMEGLSDQMKAGYKQGIKSIARTEAEAKLIDKALDDPRVTSFIRDQFDVAPVRDFDPSTVSFQTMRRKSTFSRASGGKLMGPVNSLLPSKGRKALTSKQNTMRAWESGDFDVGPEMTAHYANAELRMRNQDATARRILGYGEKIEIRNGYPVIKDGYQVYNYYGVRAANDRVDRMFRHSQRYGDLLESEEPLLSADPATGAVLDMEPEDFSDLVGLTTGKVLAEETLYGDAKTAMAKMGPERLLEAIREGKVVQIPNDVAEAYLGATGASFSRGAVTNALRSIGMVIRIPSMLARWRMIGKLAYPVLNTGATALLVGLNQGPALAFSIRRSFDMSLATRLRLMQEVGVGIAELTDLPLISGKGRMLERLQAGEQESFSRMMHWLSKPEARLRTWQMNNDLAAVGYRSEEDVVRLLDLARDEGKEGLQARALLNQIGRNAEDAVVRFRGLSPAEQFIVRDAIFVYGWLRAATRFTLQFPMNRPVTYGVLSHIGQYGWEEMQNDFWALANEQQGAIPMGERKVADDFLVNLLDVQQLLPFKTSVDTLRPFLQMMGLEEAGLRPAAIADLLSPSAEFALRAVYGEDPRYGTGFWDGLTKDVLDPRNLPGVFWAARMFDPSLTGTKLRADRDRWGIALNFAFGMMAPQEIKASKSYERWLDQQPTLMRTVIREQNNATNFAQLAQAAGAADAETIRAINADSSYKIARSLYEHEKRRTDSSFRASKTQGAALKATILKNYYPEAYISATAEAAGLNLAIPEDAESYQEIWEEAWSENVSGTNSETKQTIEDTIGAVVPERAKLPQQRDAIASNWLKTAPPSVITELRRTARRQGWGAGDHDAFMREVERQMIASAS